MSTNPIIQAILEECEDIKDPLQKILTEIHKLQSAAVFNFLKPINNFENIALKEIRDRIDFFFEEEKKRKHIEFTTPIKDSHTAIWYLLKFGFAKTDEEAKQLILNGNVEIFLGTPKGKIRVYNDWEPVHFLSATYTNKSGLDFRIREPEHRRCVHTEHCCKIHGCKYGDDENCPVVNSYRMQSFPCEFCTGDAFE